VLDKISFKEEITDIQIDHYGYIYQLKYDNLLKLNSNGETLYSYSNKLLGDISQIDVTNPLRPLLFYKDQGIVTVLDNTLSQQKQEISLNEIGLYQAKCIANSNFDNGIWLYDIDINEIIKIDHLSNIIYRSGNLSVILDKMSSPVISLYEKNKRLYAITKNKVYVLDQFGSLIKTVTISASNGLIVNENNLVCYDGAFITIYESLNFETDTIHQKHDFIKISGYTNQLIGLSKNLKDIFLMQLEY
tara:strand:+ start:155 stop:892 length:738 start_codon:yes stop_codon:yes gene_type:complete